MLEEQKVLEECLYCHNQPKPGDLCPACGDAERADSRKTSPPTLTMDRQGSGSLTENRDHDSFLWESWSNWHYCRFCMHLHSLVGKLTCNAFPEGIPKELYSGPIFHNKPMLGQENDIVFAPI